MTKVKMDYMVADKYLKVYNALKKKYQEINKEWEFNDFVKEIEKTRYTVKGRALTEDEIISYEINNLETYLISAQCDSNPYKEELLDIYRKMMICKLSHSSLLSIYYKKLINRFYCLSDRLPPFYTEINDVCKNIEVKEKMKNKG